MLLLLEANLRTEVEHLFDHQLDLGQDQMDRSEEVEGATSQALSLRDVGAVAKKDIVANSARSSKPFETPMADRSRRTMKAPMIKLKRRIGTKRRKLH